MARLCIRVPAQPESVLELRSTRVTVGRAADNTVIVDDRTVSRRHCMLERTPTGYVLHDLESKSGVLLNGASVDRDAHLRTGDVIRVGQTDILYIADPREFAPTGETAVLHYNVRPIDPSPFSSAGTETLGDSTVLGKDPRTETAADSATPEDVPSGASVDAGGGPPNPYAFQVLEGGLSDRAPQRPDPPSPPGPAGKPREEPGNGARDGAREENGAGSDDEADTVDAEETAAANAPRQRILSESEVAAYRMQVEAEQARHPAGSTEAIARPDATRSAAPTGPAPHDEAAAGRDNAPGPAAPAPVAGPTVGAAANNETASVETVEEEAARAWRRRRNKILAKIIVIGGIAIPFLIADYFIYKYIMAWKERSRQEEARERRRDRDANPRDGRWVAPPRAPHE